ncbi:MAG: barstar family protein [Beijerinckiaceae bacterium]|nr:barstar family protein [Beijerinckiaceae bacterium]
MRQIRLDASGWTSTDDFYGTLLPALGAPEWHSRGIDPLIDSIIGGGINSVETPYKIVIYNTKNIDQSILDHINLAKQYLADARNETLSTWDKDVDASIEILR